jgi:hypothetical protein
MRQFGAAGLPMKVRIGQRYGLDEVTRAHQDMEGRATISSSVLIP